MCAVAVHRFTKLASDTANSSVLTNQSESSILPSISQVMRLQSFKQFFSD